LTKISALIAGMLPILVNATGRFTHAKSRQGLGLHKEISELEQATPVIQIGHHRIEAPDALEQRLAKKYRDGFPQEVSPCPDDPSDGMVALDPPASAPPAMPANDDAAPRIDDVSAASGQGQSRVRVHLTGLTLEAVRIKEVVGPRKFDVFTDSRPHHKVEVCDRADVLDVADYPNARILVGLYNFHGLVGRSVVRDDEFKVTERLVEDGLDGLADVLLAVVDRDTDGHERTRGRHDYVGFYQPLTARWRPLFSPAAKCTI